MMSALTGTATTNRTLIDGTFVAVLHFQPADRMAAFELLGSPGREVAVIALKTAAEQQAQQANAKPAGGPLAKLAGQWCNMPQFLAWSGCNTPDTAAEFVRRECGIESRAELDHNVAAAEIFHAHIRVPFANYMMGADG
jgi:hypothetical protein